MGTYILLGAAGGYISGAPIYHRNKAQYMQQHGWNVFYISCCGGEIYVHGLEQFVIGVCSFLCKSAYIFPKTKQEELIDYMIKMFPVLDDEIVIETGTYYTAYWGELLAKRLKAKHIIIYLDEYNEAITHTQSDFFLFKFKRRELACITKNTMVNIFSEFWNVDLSNAIGLPCYCSNSLEDYDNEFTNKIKRSDYNIGYVGRLEKPALKEIICSLRSFVKIIGNKNVSLVCYGGAEKEVVDKIKNMVKEIPHVSLFISGYIFPIPLKAIKKCDMFVSSAGSSLVSAKAGVPTVRINVYSNKPDGFVRYSKTNSLVVSKFGENIIDYLKKFFIDGDKPIVSTYSLEKDKERMFNAFKQHDEFLNNTVKEKNYYNISSIHLTIKQRFMKILISCFGMRIFIILKFLGIK